MSYRTNRLRLNDQYGTLSRQAHLLLHQNKPVPKAMERRLEALRKKLGYVGG